MIIGDPAAARLVSLLEGVAAKVGVEVRYEKLDASEEDLPSSRGGFCRIRDRRVILVEESLGPIERGAVLASALRRVDLSRVYIPPAARRAIEDAVEDR